MSCTCNCTKTKKITVLSIAGLCLVVGGVLLGPISDLLVHDQVRKKLILEEGSTVFKIWKDIPFPVYQQFFIFNVDNPDEVLLGHKPNLTEFGPYTYREHRIKDNLTFENDGNELFYNERRYYTFVHEMSVGTEDDYITTVNPLLPSLVQLMKSMPQGFIIDMVKNLLLKSFSENFFHNRTVHEIIWGYKDEMLTAAHYLAPDWFYTDIVGFMAGKNDSYDGNYTISTGRDNISDLGKIINFNGSNMLDFWTTNYSNMINGTDGSLHQPFVKKDSVIYTFITDVCRSIEGVYQSSSSIRDIDVYEFIAPSSVFANVSTNPNNIGFCTPQTNCLKTGVLNVSECQVFDNMHLPAILSKPHLLDADPEYQDAINGLHPSSKYHETIIELEPITGLMLRANKRLQVNMFVSNDSTFEDMKNIKEMILPVMWINETSTIDQATADILNSMLFIPLKAVRIIRIILILIGCIIIIGCMMWLFHGRKKNSLIVNESLEKQPLLK